MLLEGGRGGGILMGTLLPSHKGAGKPRNHSYNHVSGRWVNCRKHCYRNVVPQPIFKKAGNLPSHFFSKIGKPRKIVAVAFFPSHFNEGGKLDQSRKRVQEVPLQGEAAGVENIELSQQILSVRIFFKKQILTQRPWVTYQPFSNRFFFKTKSIQVPTCNYIPYSMRQ